MATNSSGQVSYLILNSLADGSKYGLEIIEHISNATGGTYILKKPTLYSSLTRMEKKGLISSSFWGESELGGKRHYYTITNEGKKSLDLLAREFESTSFGDESPVIQQTIPVTTEQTPPAEQKPVFLKQNNLFDLVKPDTTNIEPEQTNEQSAILQNQMDIFSIKPQQESQTKEIEDDGKFLENSERIVLSPLQQEQNQKLYDTSAELKKYRKKKSFSENQIEMAVVYEKQEDIEIQKSRIEELKKSILNLKNPPIAEDKNNLSISTTQLENNANNEIDSKNLVIATEQTNLPTPPSSDTETRKDDGVFVTARMDSSEIPIQKKIGPTNIEVNIYDDNLPAPKRNSNLEPTYKDMLARLFERKKEKEIKKTEDKQATQPQPIIESVKDNEHFSDYSSLKQHYDKQGINFSEYKKSTVKRNHNTNFLKFISSCVMFLFSAISSAILFVVINSLNKLNPATNFVFYTVPAIFFILTIYEFIKYRVCISKKATLTYNAIVNWAVFILGSLIVFVINITCGMQYETIPDFLTTLLVPIAGLLIAFPINYYFKKILYKKFAK